MQLKERERSSRIVAWWERSKTYQKLWQGDFFEKMALKTEDEEMQRIQKLRERALQKPNGKAGYLSIWRARLMTESFKHTEGEAPIIRKAKAFKHVCQHIPIPFVGDQLLIGSPCALEQGGEIEPEFMTTWLERDVFVEELETRLKEVDALRMRYAEPWEVADEDLKILKEEIIPYWHGLCHQLYVEKMLEEHFPYVNWKQGHFPGKTSHPLVGWATCHTIADYASVLEKGLGSLKEEIKAEMDKIDGSDLPSNTDFDRRNGYKAMLIAADAIIIYANRCADFAQAKADEEADPKRKAELEEMAKNCRRVPEYPAESWWGAVQSLYLLRNSIQLCDGGLGHCLGRFDQYAYPYLKRDLDRGRITKQFAQSILECLFIKFRETTYPTEYHRARRVPGVTGVEKLTIGGVKANGEDATNELTFMLLEAHAHVHFHELVLSARMHRDTPDSFLKAVLQVVRVGGGIPHILNDEAIIPGLLRLGVSVEEARNYADIGCQENITDPNTCGADCNPRSNAGYFNLPKMIHLALYNGVEQMSGVQAGPKTGNPRHFKSMDEFFEAVKKQTEYAVHINCIYNNLMDWAWANWQPAPVLDLLHPGPRKKGIDYNNGGCKYNWTGAIGVGLGTAADSLTAIEWLIFDRKELALEQLLEAMDNNWVDYDHIREKCLKAPKYGKDDDYADKWAVRMSSMWMDAYEKHRTSKGGIFVGGFFSMSNYSWMGHDTWATPDGRRKSDALSSAIDPSNETELEGPARLHKSAAKLDTWRTTNGVLFNCKFPTSVVAEERELAKWADLVRTYIMLKGQSVQYTVVDNEAMKEAQKHPEQYRDLIVRTGGYSAFFVELTKEIQDTIIARTEHQF